MEYFILPSDRTAHDPAVVEPALRRAWNACAAVACSKCGAGAGRYCRNRTSGGPWRVTRFHRPRQDAAGVPRILGPVGIHGLSWAKGTGSYTWDSRPVPEL
ncbi:zinc finger domain-containing protein [Streptomyces sp. NPDC002073]